ncbi:MAG: MFS transporter [Proteobacteria bacterium]|nr:MFS transporter [Pseudomonadota bacterium]
MRGLGAGVAAVVIAGSVVLAISMGVRHVFGLFVRPVMFDLGLGAGALSFALAIQNLLRGVGQPVFGMIADKVGPVPVLVGGALIYAGGLVLMALGGDLFTFNLGAGWLVGLGCSAAGLPIVIGAIGRIVPERRRSEAFGIVTTAGSFGQFALPPLTQGLIDGFGWAVAALALAALCLAMVPLGFLVRVGAGGGGRSGLRLEEVDPGLAAALREALANRSYWLLILGFFTCGFHVTFIAVHLPAYLAIHGLPSALAGWAIGVVGLFNMVGSYLFGRLGARYLKKYLLSAIYLGRAIALVLFLAIPLTVASALAFAVVAGAIWLATVPLTSGLVALIFGPRYLATLFGMVFLSHQVGAFLGAWLGGYVFDLTGGFEPVWAVAALLALFSAAVHLPVAERPLRAATA